MAQNKRKTPAAASGLTLAQTRAIGKMTINFNEMEHSVEVFIRATISGPVEKAPLLESMIRPLGFRQKLQVLRDLVAGLEEQYVPSERLDLAYAHFASEMKKLIATAERLNDYRNNVIHWRPFLRTFEWEKKPKFTTPSAAEIDAKAAEMDNIAKNFWARALYLCRGDGTLTFGTHVPPGPIA